MTLEIPRGQEAGQEEMTKESLFPPGWDKEPESPEATGAGSDTDPTQEDESESETLAEAQGGDEEQDQELEAEQEAALGSMSYNDFLKAAGVSLESGYRDVYFDLDGEEVPVSKLVDAVKDSKKANEALLRERQELREKAKAAAAYVPQAQISPEANALMTEARLHQQRLQVIMAAEAKDPELANNPAVINEKLNHQLMAKQLEEHAAQKQVEFQNGLRERQQKALDEADMQTRARIKEWNDPNIRKTEWTAISDMLKGYGIRNTEMAAFDPGERELLRDAMRALNMQKRIKQGAKTIRKVGKVLPASSRVSNMKPKPDRKALAKQIRETANPEEAMKLRLTADL